MRWLKLDFTTAFTCLSNHKNIVKEDQRVVSTDLRDLEVIKMNGGYITGPIRSKTLWPQFSSQLDLKNSEPARLWFPVGTLRRIYNYFVEGAGRLDIHPHTNVKRWHINSPSGIRYKDNRMGPRVDPCGTPDTDSQGPKLTDKHLLDRYDLNHCKTVPLIPTQCSKWEMRIVWSTILKKGIKL